MKAYLLPLVIAGVIALQSAASYRVAVINDFHTDLNYDPTAPCITKSTEFVQEAT